MSFELQNDYLRLKINEQACITHLENVKTGCGNIIAMPKPIYRINYHTRPNMEDFAFAEDQTPEVKLDGDAIAVTVKNPVSRTGVHESSIEMRITLFGDEVHFNATVSHSDDAVLAELYYPVIGAMKTLDGGKMDLLWPTQLGEKIVDIEKTLMAETGRERLHQLTGIYPGQLSMSWTMLTGGRQCLYFANYDPLLQVSSLRAKGSETGGVSLELDKMCFVKKGQTWQAPQTVARLYAGSWREGADAYAQYAATWRRPIEPKEWMKKMNGYFLVINKQQYGDEMWPYETIPELYEYAQQWGYDVLGLFGWYHTGHDNNYPDLEVSPTMGGAEKLKEGIDAVHAKGGHVTLYYQGHLMDVNSTFYKEKGYKLESRTAYNNPYYEFYPKACNSDFARNFSRRVFSTVCPSCPEWHELMAQRIDWIASLGADGALYDQIGGMPPYPCFNEEHPHMNGKPSLSYTQGRIALHTRIRKQVSKHPGFAFMSEHITDAYSQFLDCMHGIAALPSPRTPGAKSDWDGRWSTMKPQNMMPDLFRYTFPHQMVTVRNPKPYMDRRMVNYAFVYGCKFEMELRYLTDQQDIRADKKAAERVYANAVAKLRREFEDYLLLGAFRSDEDILYTAPSIVSAKFVAPDGRVAIALWNDSDADVDPQLKLNGLHAVRYAAVSGRGEGMIPTLRANEAAIVIVEK